ncbi:arsenate reductase family protein [Shimia ponticola]|uniref:arsenate reductase family protein n=1 Tax=Shimia ponticola TaxID=2582893 RepID=UPI0011BF09C2|nr:ArsC/Spx/MgsR family protein [Shimia ponticola]
MDLYGLKTCDSCRKALKALPDANFIDVRKDGVPEDLLTRAADAFGPVIVNKSSATWRGLDAAERARNPLELVKENPTLMKRPLIVDGDKMTIGWKADAQEVWL